MYPYFRVAKVLLLNRKHVDLKINQKSELNMRVWFSDIDVYPELNNGRHLTLMDLGRYDFGKQVGLFRVLKENDWGLMVAGNFTRFRRRIKMFQRFKLTTELVGYDERWFYFYQVTLRNKIPCSSALVRTGVFENEGLVSTKRVSEAMNLPYLPEIPAWVKDWISLNEISPSL